MGSGDDVVQTRVMATFLTEMDGIENSNGIIILGATNRPEMIDDALLRPGRFDKLIYIPPPDKAARKEIFKVYSEYLHPDETLNLDELAELTEGFSGADIENICREAVYRATGEYECGLNIADSSSGCCEIDSTVHYRGDGYPLCRFSKCLLSELACLLFNTRLQ